MSTRIYFVADPETGKKRLIRAASPAAAVRHAASHICASVATQEMIVEMLTGGGAVETAGEEVVVEGLAATA